MGSGELSQENPPSRCGRRYTQDNQGRRGHFSNPPVVVTKGPEKLKIPKRKADTDAKLSETSGQVVASTGKPVQPDKDHKEVREDGHQCPSHYFAVPNTSDRISPPHLSINTLLPTYGCRFSNLHPSFPNRDRRQHLITTISTQL